MNRLLRTLALGAAFWATTGLGSLAEVRAGEGWVKHTLAAKKKSARKTSPAATSHAAQSDSNDHRAARLAALAPAAPAPRPRAFPHESRSPVQVTPTPLSASTSEPQLVAPSRRETGQTTVAVSSLSRSGHFDQYVAGGPTSDECVDESCVTCPTDDCASGACGGDMVTVSDGDGCAPAAGGTGCGPNCCGGPGCSGGCQDCYAPGFWMHRTGGFGEFLYLQPTGGDVAYVQVRDGAVPLGSVPMGPVAVTDPTYSPGFRAGFSIANTPCSSFRASYTHFESRSVETASTNVPFALHSLLTYPNTINAYSPSLAAQANHDVDFQMIDVDYRRVMCHDRCTVLNYSIGARYGQLDQDFLARQPITPGTTSVLSQVNFNGGGLRGGIDGEYHACSSGLFIYGQALASALTGRVRADYLQSNTFGLVQAQTSWKDDRIVPVLEYEVGLGWQTPGGRFKVRAGYYVAAWYNMVTTRNWINAVQNNNFVSVNDVLTFDGLVSRVEINF